MKTLEDHIKNLKWPKSGDKLFTHGDPANWLNAQVDVLGNEEKFYIYASGYKDAAEIVYKNLDSRTRVHDILVYPIVFLMRQSLELLLKDITITCNKIMGNDNSFTKTHSLKKLWDEAKYLLSKTGFKDFKEVEGAVNFLLSEFDQIDKLSFAFRYPVDTKDNESLPGISKIDLRNFMDVSMGLYNYFFGNTVQVSEYWEEIKN